MLRHQLTVLEGKVRGRVQFTNSDRLFFIQLYRWFPSNPYPRAGIYPASLSRRPLALMCGPQGNLLTVERRVPDAPTSADRAGGQGARPRPVHQQRSPVLHPAVSLVSVESVSTRRNISGLSITATPCINARPSRKSFDSGTESTRSAQYRGPGFAVCRLSKHIIRAGISIPLVGPASHSGTIQSFPSYSIVSASMSSPSSARWISVLSIFIVR